MCFSASWGSLLVLWEALWAVHHARTLWRYLYLKQGNLFRHHCVLLVVRRKLPDIAPYINDARAGFYLWWAAIPASMPLWFPWTGNTFLRKPA